MPKLNFHVYLVKGYKKDAVHPCIGWKVFSYMDIEKFSRLFTECTEYSIEVQEIYLTEMEILETWEIK